MLAGGWRISIVLLLYYSSNDYSIALAIASACACVREGERRDRGGLATRGSSHSGPPERRQHRLRCWPAEGPRRASSGRGSVALGDPVPPSKACTWLGYQSASCH